MRAAKHPLHSQVMRGEVFHARLGPKNINSVIRILFLL